MYSVSISTAESSSLCKRALPSRCLVSLSGNSLQRRKGGGRLILTCPEEIKADIKANTFSSSLVNVFKELVVMFSFLKRLKV